MLNGKYVGLRAIEEADLPILLSWRNDPALRKYFREYRELNSAQQYDWFKSKVNNDPCTRMFSIVNLETHELLGACGLCYIDWINRSADFSIYLGANSMYVDNVYAPDAATLLTEYAFSELALHRLWAEIYAFDERKNSFFRFMGFELDGRHRETHWSDGKWHDSLFFSKLTSI